MFTSILQDLNDRFLTRLFLIFLPLAALALSFAIYIYQIEKGKELEDHSAKELAVVSLGKGSISDILGDIYGDLYFIANVHSLISLLNKPSSENISHFSQDMLTFSLSMQFYDQVRWIDETGMERIRVNLNTGRPSLAHNGELQNKKNRYYFTEALRLNPGQVYVSPLDLNIEHGEIEIPFKPTLRIGTPIVDSRGNKRGVIILNYLGKHLFGRLNNSIKNSADHVMLLNRNGYFLRSPRPEEEWGFMLNRNDLTLANTSPEAWRRISTESKGQFMDAEGLWTFETVYLPGKDWRYNFGDDTSASSNDVLDLQAHQWKVVSHLSPDKLLANTNSLRSNLFFIVPLLLGLLLVGTWKVVRDYFRKMAETSTRIAATVFESKQGMMVTDSNNVILRVNRSFTDITGYSADEIVGKKPKILDSGRQDASFYESMWESLRRSDKWEGEIWNRRKNGEVFPEYLNITVVRDIKQVITNYVATFNDISLSKAAEERIERLAFYDPLTNLPNRKLLLDRLHQALATNKRSGQQGAILFIDIDDFKALNDTLGHEFGDILLQRIAEQLGACVCSADTLARIGGDEFVVVLEGIGLNVLEAATKTETIAERIRCNLNQFCKLGLHELHCTVCIGATLFDGACGDPNMLMNQAEIAMYKAKEVGRNSLCFFDPEMQKNINTRVTLENELHLAITNKQFQLYYQIQVDRLNHKFGAEALIRWNNPARGLVSPLQFIPLAEDTGLILSIGQWVLEMACAQLEIWQNNPFSRNLTLAVNVSAKQFRQVDFVAQVKAALMRHFVSPGLLKLELTESLLLANIEDTIIKMKELQMIGVQFSLDDFGTGYSSLQYLKRLPLSQLKIDQSFIRDIFVDSSDQPIVRTIIAMAQAMNLNVIAEGVETDMQRDLLMSMGCHSFQGYLFSKPVPIERFEELLMKGEQQVLEMSGAQLICAEK